MSQTEVQLIKDAVIVNADISNSAAIDVSKISGAMPLAGGTFTDDVIFSGATRNITFDKSADALEFSDEMKATFGNSGDLVISHSGTASQIQEVGTGSLHITTNGTLISIDKGATESMANFKTDGAVELFFDAVKKFETSSGGAVVTGSLGISSELNFTGNGNKIIDFHTLNGSNTITLRHQDGTTFETAAQFTANGGASLQHNGSTKFATTSAGIDVTGRVTTDELTVEKASGNLSTIINAQNGLGTIEIGGSTGAFIDLKTPNSDDFDLRVNSDGTLTSVGNIQLNVNGNENGIHVTANGAVDLYHNNVKKFETHDVGNIITQASSGVANGSLKINTTLDNYGSIIVRNQSHSNSTIGALEVENNSTGTNETNFVIRSVNLGSTAWSHAWYAAKSHRFAIEGNVNATPKVQIDLDGVKFNGDQASDNALNDFETGTWTPFVGTQGGTDYTLGTTNNCYTKIGNLVYAYFSYQFTAEGNGSISIFNLPFAADNSIDLVGQGYVTSGATRLSLQFRKYTNTLLLAAVDDGVNYQNYWTSRGSWAPTNTFVCHIVYKT